MSTRLWRSISAVTCWMLTAAILATGSLFAAYPLVTDDAGTTVPCMYELEASFDTFRNGPGEPLQRSVPFSFTHGITDRMDFGISFPYQLEPLLEERVRTASMVFKFRLPGNAAISVTNELGAGSYLINGIYSLSFGAAAVHLNAGYLSSGGSGSGRFTYAGAVESPLKGRWEVAGEVLGEQDGVKGWRAGGRFRLSDRSFIGGAYGNEFKDVNDTVSIGFHTEF